MEIKFWVAQFLMDNLRGMLHASRDNECTVFPFGNEMNFLILSRRVQLAASGRLFRIKKQRSK